MSQKEIEEWCAALWIGIVFVVLLTAAGGIISGLLNN